MAISESKKKANKKWNDKNKERMRYLNSRSSARSFIRNKSTVEDLDELSVLIEKRRKELE